MKKIFFLIFILSWCIHAESNIQCTNSGYIDLDQNKIYYGASTYQRYDGKCRPLKELSKDKWTYQIIERNFDYEICKKDNCIFLDKADNIKYTFHFNKISLIIYYDNITKIKDSKDKDKCKEIILGDSLQWKRINNKWQSNYFIWDNDINIIPIQKDKKEQKDIKNITKEHGTFIIKNNKLIYQVCKDNLNIDTNGYNFIFNSYIITGTGGNDTWNKGEFVDSKTRQKKGTGQLALNYSFYHPGSFFNFDADNYIDELGTYNATCSTCPVYNSNGKYNGGFNFSGSNSYLYFSNAQNFGVTTTVSILFWVKPDTMGTFNRLFSTRDGNLGTYAQINDLNAIQFATGNTSLTASSTENNIVNSNRFYYIALTYNGSNRRIYVDNVLEVDNVVLNQFGMSDTPFYIGSYLGSAFSNGIIDEFMITSDVLNAHEIYSIWRNSHFLYGEYISNNISTGNDSVGISNITFDFIQQNMTVLKSYYKEINATTWDLISINTTSNKTYNVVGYENIEIFVNLSSLNTKYTPEVNSFIMDFGLITTTTTLAKHKYYKEDSIIQKTNNFIDEVNIKHLIIIGLILIIIFFYIICEIEKNE